MKDLSIIIKSFERESCLRRLLRSIYKQNISSPILITDDSRKPYQEKILKSYPDLIKKYINLPFDQGTSLGRNILLKEVKTKYFLLCDDDFIFTKKTDLKFMKKILEESEFELLGGLCYDATQLKYSTIKWVYTNQGLSGLIQLLDKRMNGVPRYFFGNYHQVDRTIWKTLPVQYYSPYVPCDYVLNFFMAETESVRQKVGGWNEELKTGEHHDFFVRAKQGGLKVAHTEESGVLHLQENPPFYQKYRDRGKIIETPYLIE